MTIFDRIGVRRDRLIRSVVEPVLGTQLDLQIRLTGGSGPRSQGDRRGPRRASEDFEAVRHELVGLVTDETERLAKVFSVFDPQSELRRWRTGATPGTRHQLSADLTDLLSQSARWQHHSAGAYNPAVGEVYDRWRSAESSGVVPTVDETRAWSMQLLQETYRVEGGEVVCLGDCTGLTFNSFAKGLIADRAVAALLDWAGPNGERVGGAVVNLGGDIAVRSFPLRVGVENPLRPYDNEPPVATVAVRDGGLATSGASHRPIIIGAHTFSHLIDPRTCRPVDRGPASVTVVAASAAEADVLATIVAVTGTVPNGVAALLVGPDGSIERSEAFEQTQGS